MMVDDRHDSVSFGWIHHVGYSVESELNEMIHDLSLEELEVAGARQFVLEPFDAVHAAFGTAGDRRDTILVWVSRHGIGLFEATPVFFGLAPSPGDPVVRSGLRETSILGSVRLVRRRIGDVRVALADGRRFFGRSHDITVLARWLD